MSAPTQSPRSLRSSRSNTVPPPALPVLEPTEAEVPSGRSTSMHGQSNKTALADSGLRLFFTHNHTGLSHYPPRTGIHHRLSTIHYQLATTRFPPFPFCSVLVE